ncbi:DUF4832 domain-containing protein [Trinickia sp. NRRL B-1857]|uniref:DUF4832 domain-containing protein n=1 Tax=Trinickia sp. NRRL B-1857 TaxID=3162879 RepID=UPI003D26F701
MHAQLCRQVSLSAMFFCAVWLMTCALASHAKEAAETGVQRLTPRQLAPASAQFDPATNQWRVTGELFNPTSGFYISVAQRAIGRNNPPCASCAPDLDFIPNRSDSAPLPGTPANVYGRVSWHTLEATEGRYDFSVIDRVLTPCPSPPGKTACLPEGGTFGFRVMAFNPQIKLDTNVTFGADGYPVYSDAPAYLLRDNTGRAHGWLLPVSPSDPSQGHYFVPDWNDEFVIDKMTALLAALGRRYDNDPRIGTIDIGLYGSWGEWHTGGLPDTHDYKWGRIPYSPTDTEYILNIQAYLANNGVIGAYRPGTTASKSAIIQAHVRAFPDKQLVMLTDDSDSLCEAMRIDTGNLPIGLRRDSLGSYTGWRAGFPAISTCRSADGTDLVATRWQRAPFIVEPFGNGSSPTFPCQTFEIDPTTNRLAILEQVRQYHIADIKNASFCTGSWSALTRTQQSAIWAAGLSAGYRYAPASVAVRFGAAAATSPSPDKRLSITTEWRNTGITPTYARWRIEFRLRPLSTTTSQPAAHFTSALDLRKVLPENCTAFEDQFVLPEGIRAGSYELDLRVVDARRHALPMQLALATAQDDGYYTLGTVQVPTYRGTTSIESAASASGHGR